MIKTLRRSLRSFGRSSKKAITVGSDEGLDDPPRSSEAGHLELFRSEQGLEYTDHSSELGKCYLSDSSVFQGFRHSFQGFRPSSVMSSSKVEVVERTDMFILEDEDDTQLFSPVKAHSVLDTRFDSGDLETPRLSESILDFEPEELLIPGCPLMHHTIGFDTEWISLNLPGRSSSDQEPYALSPPYPLATEEKSARSPLHPLVTEEKFAPSPPHLSSEEEKSSASSLQSCTPDKVKPARSPLHRLFSLKKSSPNQLDRQTSIVDWALRLPSRNKEPPKSPTSTSMTFAEEVYARLLQEIALDAFRTGSDQETSSQPSMEAHSTDLSMTDEKEEFSLNVTKVGDVLEGGNSSLAQKLDSLCSNRKCITFVYKELEAGTFNFSSSKSLECISC